MVDVVLKSSALTGVNDVDVVLIPNLGSVLLSST
jgi:hypothetical protein